MNEAMFFLFGTIILCRTAIAFNGFQIKFMVARYIRYYHTLAYLSIPATLLYIYKKTGHSF